MTLLNWVKSILGLENETRDADHDVDVNVQNTPPDRSEVHSEAGADDEDPEDWGVPPGFGGENSEDQVEGSTDREAPATEDIETGDPETERSADVEESPADDDAESSAPDGATEANAGDTDDEAAATDSASDEDEALDDEDEMEWRSVDDDSAEDADETDASESDDGASPASEGSSLTDVKGIGPAYERRLSEAGIDSIRGLIDAEADSLAAATDLSDTRIERWQQRAASLVDE